MGWKVWLSGLTGRAFGRRLTSNRLKRKAEESLGPSIASTRRQSFISRPGPLRTCSKTESWHCILSPAMAQSCGLTPKSCRCSDTHRMNILVGTLPNSTSIRRRSPICLSACPATNSLSNIRHACARRMAQFGTPSLAPVLASATENSSTPAASRSTSPKGCGPKNGCAGKKSNTWLPHIARPDWHRGSGCRWEAAARQCASVSAVGLFIG
jgi:hypothetical protein